MLQLGGRVMREALIPGASIGDVSRVMREAMLPGASIGDVSRVMREALRLAMFLE